MGSAFHLTNYSGYSGAQGNIALRVPHTWAVPGEIKIASGDIDFICPMYVDIPLGQTVKIVSCRHSINSGTSATVSIQKNGVNVTGFTALSVTTNSTETNPDDVTLSDNDKISIVVTAVNGTPKNMSFTIYLEYSVP